jgi:hypothetical protein
VAPVSRRVSRDLELDISRSEGRRDVCHDFVAQTVTGITVSLNVTIGEDAVASATLLFHQRSRSAAAMW